MKPRPYTFPSMDLLDHDQKDNEAIADEKSRQIAAKLQHVIDSFCVDAKVEKFKNGAQKTTFLIELGEGVKVNKVTTLKDNFSLAVGGAVTVGLRGGMISVDVPNTDRKVIRIGDFKSNWSGCSSISFPLGDQTICDLAKMPHLLIAGTTGSGKSVCLNSIIMGLLYRNHPDRMRMLLIDPKQVEFTPFNNLPHLLTPVITDVPSAVHYLEWACNEMDARYEEFSRVGVKNFDEYNKLPNMSRYQRYVIIIDELADLMLTSKKAVEASIIRLAQKARAAGIHLVIATQRPTRDVITGLIKANMPARIAFKTMSGLDSRVILDQTGAENLLGMGDMLFKAPESTEIVRLQGVYVSNEEIERVCDFIRSQDLEMLQREPKRGFFSRLFGAA